MIFLFVKVFSKIDFFLCCWRLKNIGDMFCIGFDLCVLIGMRLMGIIMFFFRGCLYVNIVGVGDVYVELF